MDDSMIRYNVVGSQLPLEFYTKEFYFMGIVLFCSLLVLLFKYFKSYISEIGYILKCGIRELLHLWF